MFRPFLFCDGFSNIRSHTATFATLIAFKIYEISEFLKLISQTSEPTDWFAIWNAMSSHFHFALFASSIAKKVRMKCQHCLWHIDDIDTIIFRPFEEGGPPGPRGQGGESSPVPQPSSGIKSVR